MKIMTCNSSRLSSSSSSFPGRLNFALVIMLVFVRCVYEIRALPESVAHAEHETLPAVAAADKFRRSELVFAAAAAAARRRSFVKEEEEEVELTSTSTSLKMSSELEAGRIVPDVVSSLPERLLDMRVVYEGNRELPFGETMLLAQTQSKPQVAFHGAGFGGDTEKYTLMMVDPDAPSPSNPTLRNILHWLVTDIPGSTTPSQEIWASGLEKMPYMGPAPPEGLHRYVFLLFKQGPRQFNNLIQAPPTRVTFSVANFMATYKLGTPVAGYYFRAMYGN